MKVCFILDNAYSKDTRIIKQADELQKNGFNTDVVCYWREGYPEGTRLEKGVKVTRTKKGIGYLLQTANKFFTGKLRYIAKYFLKLSNRSSNIKSAKEVIHNNQTEIFNPKWSIINICKHSVLVCKHLVLAFKYLVNLILGIIFNQLGGAKFTAYLLLLFLRIVVGKSDSIDIEKAVKEETSFTTNSKFQFNIWLVIFFVSLPVLIPTLWVTIRYCKSDAKSSDKLLEYIRFIKILLNVIFSRNFSVMLMNGISAKADVYQANDPPTLLIAYLCAKINRSYLVYDSHELYDESFPNRLPILFRYFIRQYEGFFVRRADYVFTVNDSIAEILYRRYQPKLKPYVLRNAQALNSYFEEKIDFRKKYNIKEEQIIAIYAGRITYGRGLESVIQSLQSLKDKMVLILMGDYDRNFKAELDKLFTDLEENKNIIYIQSVPSDQIGLYVQDADIGLMLTENLTLSYYYGLGNKLFHYVANGLPVLVPNQPEKRGVVEQYNVGWCVEELSVDGISETLWHICEDKDSIAEKKAACFEARKELDWQKEVEVYTDAYLSLYEKTLFDNKSLKLHNS